jgi:hypothetical protein
MARTASEPLAEQLRVQREFSRSHREEKKSDAKIG